MSVSEHFTWEEVCTTYGFVPNDIPETLKPYAEKLALEVLEPLRVVLGPLSVNSWYRSPAVNKAVGGEAKSAHLEARAADVVPRGDVFKAFKMALALIEDLPIDQIIFERRNSQWLHIAIAKDGAIPRRMALIAEPDVNGRMVYRRYHE